jgi:hypothetical protein
MEGQLLWDASTEELEAGAVLALFRHLDEEWQVYGELTEEPYLAKFPENHPDGCMCEPCQYARETRKQAPVEKEANAQMLALYKRAKKGEAQAAKILLHERASREYEKYAFVSVESETSTYPKREWGVTKPCGVGYVHKTGLIRWGNHGRLFYSLEPTLDLAVKRLTAEGGVLRYDISTREEVLIEEPWALVPFRARKVSPATKTMETEEEYACAMLNVADPKNAAHAMKVLALGTIPAGEKVLKFTKQVCPSCAREMERFDP